MGTSVVTGSGAPTASLVYKLVEVDGRPVAKRSASKESRGGAKSAVRRYKPTGTAVEGSDWDFGLYYRGGLDPADITALGWPGRVFAPGEWGTIVNGGAWLTVDGAKVDLIYRDLDEVLRWTAAAMAVAITASGLVYLLLAASLAAAAGPALVLLLAFMTGCGIMIGMRTDPRDR